MPLPLPLQRRDWTRRMRALDAAIGARVLQAYARHIAALERATAIAASNAGAERGEGLLAGQRAAAEAQRLREAIEREIRTFTPALSAAAREGVTQGIEAGQAVALGMIGTQTGATLNTLNGFGVSQMIGIVDSEPFRAALNRFGPAAGQKAADILLTGIAAGMGPARIAKRLRDFVVGEMRQWAETTARTAMLTSFRRASHETYRANADVVGSWMWWAALGSRTCLSCISQHGSVHPLSEELNDHHRGRCLISGELVTTARGNIPIEHVQVGDIVLTHEGRWRPVIRTFSRDYNGAVLSIKSGNHSVTVTPEHPIWTQRGWVEARALRASDTFLILNSNDVRGSSLRTVHPNSDKRMSRLVSVGRFLGDLCQRASHSTASLTSGKAKSMLYDSTANCGTGSNPAEWSASRNSNSPSDMWLRVCSLITAVLKRASILCPPFINDSRNAGLRDNWRLTASLPSIGAIPNSSISDISERVLMLNSAVNSRYDAPSVSYRRFRYEASGSDSLASSAARHRWLFSAPVRFGSTSGKDKVTRRVWTAFSVRPITSAISRAVIRSWFSRRNVSSSDDQTLPAMLNLHSSGTIIQQSQYGGKVYDLEVETDHSFIAGGIAVHNCSPLPIVRGTTWAGNVQRGEQWFDRQSAGVQREMLGPSAYAAYRRGEWDWSRVSVEYQDAVYGAMRRAATLGEMGIERVR